MGVKYEIQDFYMLYTVKRSKPTYEKQEIKTPVVNKNIHRWGNETNIKTNVVVDTSRFELKLTEPKSVVLPLHYVSIISYLSLYVFLTIIN